MSDFQHSFTVAYFVKFATERCQTSHQNLNVSMHNLAKLKKVKIDQFFRLQLLQKF